MCWPAPSHAQASYNGISGYINTPSAYMQADGTWRIGFSYAYPYAAVYSSVQALPWIEVAGRFTQIANVPALTGNVFNTGYGSLKDKSVAFKLRLLEAGSFGLPWLPQLAFGVEDKGLGTSIFANYYAVASQRAPLFGGQIEASLGYGRQRIDGVFGGLRYAHPSFPSWRAVVEYDRTDFRRDPGATVVGVASRKIGRVNAALEYDGGGYTVQAGFRDGQPALNAYLTVPLERREFLPKITEPAPYISVAPRPSEEEWLRQDRHWKAMVKALHDDGGRHVRFNYGDRVMRVSLANNRQLSIGRAIGRAARVVLAHSPLQTEKIEITYTQNEVALATFSFFDVPTLQRYFNGVATRSMLMQNMTVRYAQPGEADPQAQMHEALEEFTSTFRRTDGIALSRDTNLLSFNYETHQQTQFYVGPYLSLFLNDPSGALKYDFGLDGSLRYRLARGTYLEAGATLRLVESVSDVVQPSNSVLPHVRSDVAEYARAGRLKLNRLLVNHYWQPAERWYARASAGYYEEMFGGAGGQVLYVPPGARWAADLSVDWLAQRKFRGLGFQNYRVLTGQLSMHYKLPYDITATARVGRFLAKDEGVRFEAKRQFKSGVQMGVWYTTTNGKDITSPGSPSSPYKDKGIFVSLPLEMFLTRNSAATGTVSLSPWTRDVGQMVQSPADLFRQVERGFFRGLHEGDGLRGFGDVPFEDAP